ncbi:MAG: hypothetical protein COW48_00640 [Hydrogenophilales bacterium CG17_big_fil_post_rev_8_21_14_2_50_63_12]|nr:MAG: hypothetical protein COW48_00640 [Hydrogenophilales bacterium CG17_big_fil_post_rev_8_21_14_2_50_63_12]PIX96715.1 MAG: hypothetical protein COZ24_09160 [Hydrogenophilales bacterium CG_4_10_14_3_um_filter_63_21]PJB02521.1 MAG: hypothetical protein CO126_11565 [Hydrogenophilales bacterium CG_4_9_14_3_um_filter_63_34]
MTVQVNPLPAAYRSISKKFRPTPPPVFPNGEPTADEIELARELFALLDAESREWYGSMAVFAGSPRATPPAA